jgi:hypothetical protein
VAEVPNRLVQANQSLLDQIFGIAAGEEVRARLQADEPRVAPDQCVERDLVAVSRTHDELEICELALLSLNRVRWG